MNTLELIEIVKNDNRSFWQNNLKEQEAVNLTFLKLESKPLDKETDCSIKYINDKTITQINEINFSFNQEAIFKLNQLGKKYNQITPHIYGHSIYALLLHKYTGQKKFFYGYPVIINQNLEIADNKTVLIIPICYDFTKITNFIDLINYAEDSVNLTSNSIPIEEIEYLYNTCNNLNIIYSESKLLDIDIGFDNNRKTTTSITELLFEQELYNHLIKYKVRYDSIKINKTLLENFIDCYQRLFLEVLEELVNLKNTSFLPPITYYSLLFTKQCNRIIYDWNATDSYYPSDKTIHQLFEEQVEKVPNNIAVIYKNLKLTYLELNEEANKLAHYIRRTYDIQPDTLIGLFIDSSEYMLISMLAVLKTGGAYVPISLDYPAERIKYILSDINTNLILTNTIHKQRLEKIIKSNTNDIDNILKSSTIKEKQLINKVLRQINIVVVDNDELKNNLLWHSSKNPNPKTSITNLANVIYTSGTTGTPKGVMIEHRGVISLVKNIDYINIDPSNTFIHFADVSFDATSFEVWAPLLNGAKLLIPHNKMDLFANIDLLYNILIINKVSILFLTKALFDKLFLLNDSIFKDLQYLLIGGEILNKELVCRLVNSENAPQNVINVYGPTEGTIFSSALNITINKDNIANMDSIPIGIPLTNRKSYVLGSELMPLPVGAIGELYIGGLGIARGYLNKPALTAERFISNPFQTEAERSYKSYGKAGKNSRIYKTGDLVRWLPDGNLEYIGRNDFQIKIRGFRIELGEIENALNKYEGIHQSVVIVLTDKEGSKYIAAYYVAVDWLSEQDIKLYLRQLLPNYMIPQTLTWIENIPLTISGKVDTKALPHPSKRSAKKKLNNEYPQTSTEQVLFDIWKNLFHLEEINVDDDFLLLGGHSLLALSLVQEIYQRLSVKLNIGAIFRHPNIEALAVYIDSMPKIKIDYQEEVQIPYLNKKINIPLTFSQEQIWIHEHLANDAVIYNEPFSITMPMEIAVHALEYSINEIIKRHEILRSRINVVNGMPVQNIVDFSFLNLNFIDLTHIKSSDHRQKEAHKIGSEQAKKPFDLENESLIRFTLIRLNGKLYKLFIVAHHIIIDGVSLYQILLPELIALYKAFINKAPLYLPKLDIQYTDFALWQRSKVLDQSEALLFWKKQLLGAKNVPLMQNNKDVSFNGTTEILAFPSDLIEGLIGLSVNYKTSRFIIILTTLNVLLFKYTEQTDISIISPVSGRNYAFTKNIFGNFLNTIIFRNTFTYNSSFADLLQLVSKNAFEAYENEKLPFQDIIRVSSYNNTKRLPFQISLTIEPNLDKNDLDWELSQLDIHTDTAKFDLTIELDEREEGVIGRVEYNTDAFSKEFIKNFIGHLQNILRLFIKNPLTRINEFSLLSTAEAAQILIEWNKTETGLPIETDKTIHQLFEEQTEKTPDNIAVVYRDLKLTYLELNKKANKLANYLRQTYDIQPGTLIALCLDRSEHILIAILAILKTGGAYVPIDPSYPNERIRYILEDTATRVVLINELYKERLKSIVKVNTINNTKSSELNPLVDIIAIDSKELQELILSQSTSNPSTPRYVQAS